MEIHVMSADTEDTVLAHEYRGVGVMKQITGNARKFGYYLCGNLRVLLRMHKHAKSRRCQQCSDKFPGGDCVPGPTHHSRVRRDPQEFIHDRPSRVPGFRFLPLQIEPPTTWAMEWRIGICGIYQHIRIDDEH